MSVLSSAQVTLAWSAGILATVRYYQLAAPTAATPTVPTSSSSLGSWTETEPTADVTKVLWTCERTVYADGTESWSKASKSTSYEAAKDAKSTAKDAQTAAGENSTAIDSANRRIEAEENARKDTDKTVQGVSIKLENVQNGLQLQINSVSDGLSELAGWIKATTDSDGNPELDIASSSSTIVSKQTNSGLRYEDKSGDALLELNAKKSLVTADHFAATDVSVGKWQWVPTNGGANLTLMWIGG